MTATVTDIMITDVAALMVDGSTWISSGTRVTRLTRQDWLFEAGEHSMLLHRGETEDHRPTWMLGAWRPTREEGSLFAALNLALNEIP